VEAEAEFASGDIPSICESIMSAWSGRVCTLTYELPGLSLAYAIWYPEVLPNAYSLKTVDVRQDLAAIVLRACCL